MGVPINMLPTTTTVSGGDQVVLWLPNQGSAYKASLTTVLDFFEDNFANPEFTTVQATIGGSTAVDFSTRTTNMWLIANPSGGDAGVNLTLPSAPFDGQSIIVTCSVPFFVDYLGTGAPSTLAAIDGSVIVRYSSSTETWHPISAGGVGLVSPRIADSILDENGNEVLGLGAVADAVNYVEITNAATGDAVVVQANGGDSNISLIIRAQGLGRIEVESDLATGTNLLRQTSVAVASLPSAITSAGARAVVNNATQTLTAGIGAVVAGGGANVVPVFCDGSNWRIG
jgi:hypothetical protein